jgi:hypothetical protein
MCLLDDATDEDAARNVLAAIGKPGAVDLCSTDGS